MKDREGENLSPFHILGKSARLLDSVGEVIRVDRLDQRRENAHGLAPYGSIRLDAEHAQEAVQIVGTVVFDRDVPFLLGVGQGDTCGEAVLELVLDALEGGREFHGFAAFPAAPFPGSRPGEMIGNELLGIADGTVRADEFLRE